jgi:hypothetical protein
MQSRKRALIYPEKEYYKFQKNANAFINFSKFSMIMNMKI